MTQNDIFSIKRFQLFFQRYLFLNYKGVFIAFASISGLLIFIAVLTSIGHSVISQEAFIVLSYVSYFLGGAIITSACFNELHKPEKSIHFLTLPASPLEKFATAYISTTVIYSFVAVAFYYIAYYVASLLAMMLTNTPLEPINFFDAELIRVMEIYFVAQSVFFLGAIYFRGHNFLKTLLSLFIISFAVSILQTLFSLMIFGDLIFSNIDESNWNAKGNDYFMDTLLPMVKIIGLYMLPIFLLVVSYIRFNEREA